MKAIAPAAPKTATIPIPFMSGTTAIVSSRSAITTSAMYCKRKSNTRTTPSIVALRPKSTPTATVITTPPSYIYDGWDVVVDFVDADGDGGGSGTALAPRYLHRPAVDQILAQENVSESTSSANRTYWLLGDHQNTTRDVLNNSGSLVSSGHIAYDSFGQITSGSTSLTGAISTPGKTTIARPKRISTTCAGTTHPRVTSSAKTGSGTTSTRTAMCATHRRCILIPMGLRSNPRGRLPLAPEIAGREWPKNWA